MFYIPFPPCQPTPDATMPPAEVPSLTEHRPRRFFQRRQLLFGQFGKIVYFCTRIGMNL